MERIYRYLLLLIQILLLPIGFIIPLLCIPFMPFSSTIPIKITACYAHISWSVFNELLKLSAKIEYFYDGDTLPTTNKNTVIISNHIGSTDFMLINNFAKKCGMLSHVKYLVKDATIFIPIFGIGMYFLNFMFLKRKISVDRLRIKKYCDFTEKNRLKLWMVVYAEGTRFTADKQQDTERVCRERGIRVFKNVLFPKSGGLKLILENAKKMNVEKILDLTIYFEGRSSTPSLFDVCFGRVKDGCVKIKVDLVDVDVVKDAGQYLVESFVRKDELIEKWRIEEFGK